MKLCNRFFHFKSYNEFQSFAHSLHAFSRILQNTEIYL